MDTASAGGAEESLGYGVRTPATVYPASARISAVARPSSPPAPVTIATPFAHDITSCTQ